MIYRPAIPHTWVVLGDIETSNFTYLEVLGGIETSNFTSLGGVR